MPKNTLFNYFVKSPKVDSSRKVSSPIVGSIPERISESQSPKEGAKQSTPNDEFNAYDVVWAKLGNFPWWPSIVCNHPKSANHVKGKGKKCEVHVQFFENPPSRSWVKKSFLRHFKGANDKTAPITDGDSKWKLAVEAAEEAYDLEKSKRVDLITCTVLSDEDELEEMDDDEIDGLNSPKSKKRKINANVLSDLESDSEDDYKPDKKGSESDSGSSGVDENMISEPESEEPLDSPIKSKKRKRPSRNIVDKTPKSEQSFSSFKTPDQDKSFSSPSVLTPSTRHNISISSNTKVKLSLFSTPTSDKNSSENSSDGKIWNHLKYEWLQDGKRRDKERRTQDHPDYDPRTLHIPESVKKTLTPALRQWWEMKSNHFDTILFFKVGKFYELYHQDAVIAVNELGLLYMRGEYAHSGFPEIAFSRYADMLIEKGYKVARIEQTETPAMMEERCKKMGHATKFDKVVKREICRVLSKGARTCSFIDGNSHNPESNYLLAIKEKKIEDCNENVEFGVTFIDTTIGKFYMGQFKDDCHRSRFRTLISRHPPSQILIERGNLSSSSQLVIETVLTNIMKDVLSCGSEFWSSKKTLKFLSDSKYFCKDSNCEKICFPEVLSSMLDKDDALSGTASSEKDLAVQSLGACVWYLKNCYIEHELISMKSFEEYFPVDCITNDIAVTSKLTQQNMVLDGITLQNLDVIENGSTGTDDGTLLKRINNCITSFGKRLIRQWLCSPLCNPAAINDRLNGIEDLIEIPEIVSEVSNLLKKVPDLERLLSKIHTQGSANRSKTHPESRAIFFEEAIYSKRKIMDFINALDGYKVTLEIVNFFSKCSNLKSKLLNQCITYAKDGGHFPELKQYLDFFDSAFDHEKAQKDGKIIPCEGVDEEYDSAIAIIESTEKELNSYLNEQQKILQCKMKYFGTGKNRFQLEIPEQSIRRLGHGFEVQSQRKGFKRYWTPFIKENLKKIMLAEDKRDAALRDIMRRIFEQFDSHYQLWLDAVQCMAVLDVLINLTNYSKSDNMCRPEVISNVCGEKPFIEISNGYHPCVNTSYSGGEFIPNDISIALPNTGSPSPSLIIVTGPNMGGKSTLMRQTGLLIILAQLGCYVPASKCKVSPVDRIFTRLGASDKIMSGESTFFVELNETSSILKHATQHSLVLMDELGRGTATYDGTAIASAVIQELNSHIHCRTLFSTHYHSLVESFSMNSNIGLGHMACMVENVNDDDPSQETITFLYKFIEGACPKSYGFNAARLARLPENVIREGQHKAKEFEKTTESNKLFRTLMAAEDPVDALKNLKL